MTAEKSPVLCKITQSPINTQELADFVADPTAGAMATFVGMTRNTNEGRQVTSLEYECYPGMAEKEMEKIAAEVLRRWPIKKIAMVHRLGRVDIGEASVAIAAASPHRSEAFAACRYAIERIKQVAPVWKHEHFEGGDVWIEGATADPGDDAARRTAFERACS